MRDLKQVHRGHVSELGHLVLVMAGVKPTEQTSKLSAKWKQKEGMGIEAQDCQRCV